MKTRKDPLIVVPAADFDRTIATIIDTVYRYRGQTDNDFFDRGPDDTLQQYCCWLWEWARSNINYRPDSPFHEEIRTPNRTIADRKTGVDCEDFVIYLSTVLLNNRVPHSLRVADYGSGWQHIYIIVKDRKREIVLDAVKDRFDVEQPYLKVKDYRIKSGQPARKGLSGIDKHYPELWRNEAKIVYLKKFAPISFNDLSADPREKEKYFLKVAKASLKANIPYIAYTDAYGTNRSYGYNKVMWTTNCFLISADADMVYISYAKLEPVKPIKEKPKANKFDINQDIERILEAKNTYTKEELGYFRQYSGSGGKGKDGATGEGLLYEFYTPDWVAVLMWEIARANGYNGGAVLEPSCATGLLFEGAPADAPLVGFEINPYSAKIAQLLYPRATIHNRYFETAFLDPATKYRTKLKNKRLTWLNEYPFDLVIGNPPYGIYQNQYSPYFPELKKMGFRQIETAFMCWSLQLLRPGGLLVFLTASNFMRTGIAYQQAKATLGQMADLADAYRLPGVFDNSSVPTDILVFRKKI